MSEGQATAVASANIAFIKYWGNLVPELRLPFNDSLSMNLSDATTTTRVRFEAGLDMDYIAVDGRPLDAVGHARVEDHLDEVRRLAGSRHRAEVVSSNTFPMGTGIASSASGFAALSLAAAAAAGLDLGERELSTLARLGSGSAARSVPGGFVYWRSAPEHEESYAYSLAPADHWDLRDIVAVVSREHKAVGSGGGHDAATQSPYFATRLTELHTRLPEVRDALLERDMSRFGPAIEAEALSLHAVALTNRPPILYLAPGTVALMRQTAEWRAEGLPVYFTLDAGPNVHLLCEAEHAPALESALSGLDYIESWIHNRPAGPATLVVSENP